MFNRIKSFFTENLGVATEPVVPVTVHDEYVPLAHFAEIRQRKNGKFILLYPGNEVVAEYSRFRDAVRGAARRGLTVA